MNKYTLIGLMAGISVIIIGLKFSSSNLLLFWDGISLFIVLGGTVAVMALSIKLDKMYYLSKAFFLKILRGKNISFTDTIKEIVSTAKHYEIHKNFPNKSNDQFLNDSLLLLSEKIMPFEKALNIIKQRSEQIEDEYFADASKIKTLGKYPPAFGMMGTTIGMIVLLSNLGTSDAMKSMGPAMAICLITTLYGVIIANFFLLPLSENLVETMNDMALKNSLIIRGLDLINQKVSTIEIIEELNARLPASHRYDWRKTLES